MSKPHRVEYVDRIIESLDVAGRRTGPPRKRFSFTRAEFREHLLLAYGNGGAVKYGQIKRAIELMDWRTP